MAKKVTLDEIKEKGETEMKKIEIVKIKGAEKLVRLSNLDKEELKKIKKVSAKSLTLYDEDTNDIVYQVNLTETGKSALGEFGLQINLKDIKDEVVVAYYDNDIDLVNFVNYANNVLTFAKERANEFEAALNSVKEL